MPRKELFWIIFVFLLALSLRIAYVLFLKQNYLFFDQPSSDVKYYQQWAQDIASGDWIGKGPFYGMPLYAYFLAVIKRLALNNEILIRLFHLILGSLNCVLVYVLAKRIFSVSVARLASVLTATNFILIYYDWLMMPVGLTIFLSLGIILFLLNKENLQKGSEWFILGLLWGLTALADGKMIIFFALCLAWLLKSTQQKSFSKALLPLFLGFMLIISGVAVRNKIMSGDWILISAQTGLSFYVGNNPQSDGLYDNPAFIRPTHDGQDEDQQLVAQGNTQKALGPAGISAYWRDQALQFIKNSPGAYLQLLVKKFFLFFKEVDSPDEIDLFLQKEWKQRFDLNSFYILCPLAILGLLLAWKNRIPNTAFINLLLLSQLIFTLMFFLTIRHRATILPLLIIFEAYAVVWLIQKRSYKTISLAVGIIFLYWMIMKPVDLPVVTAEYIRHANAGVLYTKQKNYKLAQAHYLKALEIQPFDTNTLFNLANSYFYEEDLDNAQKYYEKTLALFPLHVDARFNLGYTFEKKGELEKAEEVFSKLRQDQPQQIDILVRLTYIYSQLNRCSEASESAFLVIQKNPALKPEIENLLNTCR